MKKRIGWAIPSALALGLLCGCGASRKTTVPLKDTLKASIVDARGSTVDAAPLLETDYLLFYFSAHWCPPCKAFTPRFVDFYNTHGGGRLFQAMLVSSDKSEEKMLSYMRETKMPWPAMRFDSAGAKVLKENYSGAGIPRLVLVDPQGTVIADSYDGKKYLGPQHVLDYLQKRLAKTTARPAKTPVANENPAGKFKLSGFGKKAGKSMAIINGKLVTVGMELDKGVLVAEITDTYVEISIEGSRYRLYSASLQTNGDPILAEPVKIENRD